MKNSILLIFLFSFLISFAQPSIQWQKSFGGTGGDVASSIKQIAEGKFIIAGGTSSTDGDISSFYGNTDLWLLQSDNTGSIIWQKSLGGTGDEKAYSIQQTNDGGYIIAGSTFSTDGDITNQQGLCDYWVVKTDSLGNLQWQKSLGGSSQDEAYSIQQTTDGGYIVAGFTFSTDGDIISNQGFGDYWIVKLNNAGSIQWQKSLGGSEHDQAYFIQQTSDSGYIIAGSSGSNNGDVTGNLGDYDFWIVKLDSIGTLQWQKCLGGTNKDIATSIQQTIDGGYIVAGYSGSANNNVTGNHGGFDYWIVKLDITGVLQWQKSLGGSDDDHAMSIQQSTDGGYIVAGYSYSNDGNVTGNHGDLDYWVVKLDNLGGLQWQKTLGSSGVDEAYSILQTTDGGYIIAGCSGANDGDVTVNQGFSDLWLVKFGPEYNFFTETNQPEAQFSISPNPTSGKITIQTQQSIVLTAYVIKDIMGRTLISGNLLEDNTEIDVSILSEGLYFITTTSKTLQTSIIIKQ